MARRIDRLRKLFQSREKVQDTASAARALAAMIGAQPQGRLVGAKQMSRALLTARVIQAQGNIPWPTSISRELDVDDPAFLPPLGAHLPLSARDATVMGFAGQKRLAWVDPWGWCGPQGGPMITIWFGDQEQSFVVGKLPFSPSCSEVTQKRSDDGHGIHTIATVEDLQLELFHWPITWDEQTAWALVARVRSKQPKQLRLAFVIRPMDRDGAQPIFQLDRDAKGTWKANNKPILSLAQPGQGLLYSQFLQQDAWFAFKNQDSLVNSQPLDLRCFAGQLSAAEIYTAQVEAGEYLSRFAIIAPPNRSGMDILRVRERSLWAGAIADRKSLLSAGSRIRIGDNQVVFDAACHRLLIDQGPPSLASCMGVVALARLGFVEHAGRRLHGWYQRSVVDSSLTPMILWATTEFLLWTQARSWIHAHERTIHKLLQKLAYGDIAGSGHDLFGPDGSIRWSEIWRVAALLNAVRSLDLSDKARHTWGLAGAKGRENLREFLGPAPWSGAKDRAPDGASAALLAAGWLGLLPLDDSELLKTMEFLSGKLHNHGVLLKGGAHVGATAIWLAIQQRRDSTLQAADQLAAFASPTGALPTARHQQRGALGQGDDRLSAALFLLLVLDTILVEKNLLLIGSQIREAQNLPTPYGRLDIHAGKAKARWRGKSVRIVFR